MERTSVTSVWSPAQGMSLWLAAWLYGRCSYDELIDAMADLGGPHTTTLEWGDTVEGAEFLRFLRKQVAIPLSGPGAVANPEAEPILRLVMSGPGDVPALPAGSYAAGAAARSGAAIVLTDAAEPGLYQVLAPQSLDSGTRWHRYEVDGPLPALPHLSPGEADLALSDAVRSAAKLVQQRHPVSLRGVRSPRLTVGALSDVLAIPGMPDDVPIRAQRLFARADQVDAILEVAANAGSHSHALDPELLPLRRTVRAARIVGVDYTQREWIRQAATA